MTSTRPRQGKLVCFAELRAARALCWARWRSETGSGGTGDLRGGRKVLMAGQQPAGSPRGTRRFGASNGLIAVSPERCVSHCRNFQNMGVPVLVDSGCAGAQL